MKLKTKNKLKLLILITTFLILNVAAQNEKVRLNGLVKHNTTYLQDINIINKTTKLGTSSDKKGKYTIYVSKGDSILFSSVNYKNRIIKITDTHVNNKSITVYLEADLNQLEEVMLAKKTFINWRDAAVEKGTLLDYDKISSSKAPDARKLTDPNANGGGINFVSIFKKLTQKMRKKRRKEKREREKIIELKNEFPVIVRNLYGDDFFKDWLNISEYKINIFLDYCQDNGLSELYNSDEIIVKNFLIKQSKNFNKINN